MTRVAGAGGPVQVDVGPALSSASKGLSAKLRESIATAEREQPDMPLAACEQSSLASA